MLRLLPPELTTGAGGICSVIAAPGEGALLGNVAWRDLLHFSPARASCGPLPLRGWRSTRVIHPGVENWRLVNTGQPTFFTAFWIIASLKFTNTLASLPSAPRQVMVSSSLSLTNQGANTSEYIVLLSPKETSDASLLAFPLYRVNRAYHNMWAGVKPTSWYDFECLTLWFVSSCQFLADFSHFKTYHHKMLLKWSLKMNSGAGRVGSCFVPHPFSGNTQGNKRKERKLTKKSLKMPIWIPGSASERVRSPYLQDTYSRLYPAYLYFSQ